jgi:periplasmic protein TonB
MKKVSTRKPDQSQSLDDLAFEGRNKSYGSYYLRRKYLKYVTSSLAMAIIILVLMAVIPFVVYYFQGSDTILREEDMYMVDYTFMPAPDEDMSALARSLPKPVQEAEQAPVVVDSIKEPDKKPSTEPLPVDEKTEETPKTDSAGTGNTKNAPGEGTGSETGVYTIIDVYPRFPGGDEARLYFLRNNIRYPESALKNGIQGVVMLIFIIEQDGSVSDVKVNKGIGGGCDEEAMRVTRIMPRWEPGKRSGRAVRVMVRMPIVFKIPGRMKIKT